MAQSSRGLGDLDQYQRVPPTPRSQRCQGLPSGLGIASSEMLSSYMLERVPVENQVEVGWNAGQARRAASEATAIDLQLAG